MIGRIFAGLALALLFATGAAARPLVVILADARGTVATDLLAPFAILADSGAVEVKVVAETAAPVRLTPGHAWAMPQMTLAELAKGPRPDVVIVPAMSVEDDPARAAWLKAQMARGVRILSICNGARVLAASGLLGGRQATVHWFSHDRMVKRHPTTIWRQDRRWVVDGPVTTTAGISAGEPASLSLLQDLAGEAVMRRTAQRLNLALPDVRHDGTDYRLTPRGMGQVVLNRAAFWGYERIDLPLSPGVDELAFGTALDAWSRTYRSEAWATGPAEVVSRHGLRLRRSHEVPGRFHRRVTLPRARIMETTFDQVRAAYGEPTARFVALQFEHPYGAVSAW